MQNKKSFPDYSKFIENFNQKVVMEKLEFDVKILMARLRILNTNWDKNPKKGKTSYQPNDKPNSKLSHNMSELQRAKEITHEQ